MFQIRFNCPDHDFDDAFSILRFSRLTTVSFYFMKSKHFSEISCHEKLKISHFFVFGPQKEHFFRTLRAKSTFPKNFAESVICGQKCDPFEKPFTSNTAHLELIFRVHSDLRPKGYPFRNCSKIDCCRFGRTFWKSHELPPNESTSKMR